MERELFLAETTSGWWLLCCSASELSDHCTVRAWLIGKALPACSWESRRLQEEREPQLITQDLDLVYEI